MASVQSPEQILIIVRELLLDLYNEPTQIGRLADRAKIKRDNLALSGTANDAVTSLVDEAWKRRRIPALLHVVHQDYGNDRPEISEYIEQAEKLTPTAPVNLFRTATVNVDSDRPADTTADRVIRRPPHEQPTAERGQMWALAAEKRLQTLRAGLDELQHYIDVLREVYDNYAAAAELAKQARRLEQLTDNPLSFLPVRSYRDNLFAIIDAHDTLRGIDISMWLAKVSPPLSTPELSTGYGDTCKLITTQIENLKNARTEPPVANDIATDLTYASKKLQAFWLSILQSMYLRLGERLQQMRAVLEALEI